MIVLAGPNGAGKSTVAPFLLPKEFEYINADEDAKGLPGYPSRATDLQAGRMALERMQELGEQGADFAVETTLSGRTLANRLRKLRSIGYSFRLIFLWSPSPELSIQRVAERVRRGGHDIPEGTIRRRYCEGMRNLFTPYQRVADLWYVYDTSRAGSPRLIAEGTMDGMERVQDPELWERVRREADDG